MKSQGRRTTAWKPVVTSRGTAFRYRRERRPKRCHFCGKRIWPWTRIVTDSIPIREKAGSLDWTAKKRVVFHETRRKKHATRFARKMDWASIGE